MLRVLSVALCFSAALAANPTPTTLGVAAAKGAKAVSLAETVVSGFAAGNTVRLIDGDNTEVNFIESVVGDTVNLKTALERDFPAGTKFEYYEAAKPTDAPAPKPTVAPTTTLTAWDSSASASGDSSGSGSFGSSAGSSGSLRSIGSGAAAGDSSSGDSSSGSFNQGSWQSDSSGSASSGSTASGSWGSQLPVWLWIVIVAALCVKCGVLAACCGAKKPKKKKKASKPKAPAPVEEPLPEAAPLMEIPPLMPLATTSQIMPSYSMVAQPQYAYAQAPATTSYQYAAAPAAYAQPQFTYAAPQTGSIV